MLPEGTTRVGRSTGASVPQDVTLDGVGIRPEHCVVVNDGNGECRISIATPLAVVMVDGEVVDGTSKPLQHVSLFLPASLY